MREHVPDVSAAIKNNNVAFLIKKDPEPEEVVELEVDKKSEHDGFTSEES